MKPKPILSGLRIESRKANSPTEIKYRISGIVLGKRRSLIIVASKTLSELVILKNAEEDLLEDL
jgi:hypothetical protein